MAEALREVASRSAKGAGSAHGPTKPPAKAPSAQPSLPKAKSHGKAPPRKAEPSGRETFAECVPDVEPLRKTAVRRAAPEKAKAPRALASAPFETEDDGASVWGRRLDVDPRELGALRRGAFPMDRTLDLHGLTALVARRKIALFLKQSREQGDRAVRLVVGKGLHSPLGLPVLRGEIAAWLSQTALAAEIRAFCSEPSARSGQFGAVRVLLERR